LAAFLPEVGGGRVGYRADLGYSARRRFETRKEVPHSHGAWQKTGRRNARGQLVQLLRCGRSKRQKKHGISAMEQLSTLERTAHEENRGWRDATPITFFHFEPRNR